MGYAKIECSIYIRAGIYILVYGREYLRFHSHVFGNLYNWTTLTLHQITIDI